MMVLILVRCPMCCPLKALMTRKKTRTGAMAFNAPTKISPSMDITVTCGIVSPKDQSEDQSADDSFNETDLIPFFNYFFHKLYTVYKCNCNPLFPN